jgi:hypothetical protein
MRNSGQSLHFPEIFINCANDCLAACHIRLAFCHTRQRFSTEFRANDGMQAGGAYRWSRSKMRAHRCGGSVANSPTSGCLENRLALSSVHAQEASDPFIGGVGGHLSLETSAPIDSLTHARSHGIATLKADVAELVDAPDLGSGAERRGGSSPFIRTNFPGVFRRYCKAKSMAYDFS